MIVRRRRRRLKVVRRHLALKRMTVIRISRLLLAMSFDYDRCQKHKATRATQSHARFSVDRPFSVSSIWLQGVRRSAQLWIRLSRIAICNHNSENDEEKRH